MKNIKVLIYIVSVFLFFLNSVTYAENAAPYTEEAYMKLESTIENNPPFIQHHDLSDKNDFPRRIEYLRKIFNKAGYNYDDTLFKVIKDLQNNPESVPLEPNTVSAVIIWEIIYMLALELNQAELSKLFSPAFAEALNDLIKNVKYFSRHHEPEPLILSQPPPVNEKQKIHKSMPAPPPPQNYYEVERYR